MLKLNLYENDNDNVEVDISSYENLILQEEELAEDMRIARESISNLKNIINFCNVLQKYGGYPGFEELVNDYKELNSILGIDIAHASSEQLEDIYSNEILRDNINKFFAKVSSVIGRACDRISNFIKTILPFKEKYLKEMTELKQILSGKQIDEERFQEKKVASALDKQKFEQWYNTKKDFLTKILEVLKKTDSENLEKFFQAADNIPETIRTSFGTFFNQPWKSWFTTAKVSSLGWKGSDVVSVLDKGIESIKSIEEIYTGYAKWNEQLNRLETQISQDRAVGKVDEAIAKREQAANAYEFIFQICEAASIYHTMIRREMYFATYLGRAAKQCIK